MVSIHLVDPYRMLHLCVCKIDFSNQKNSLFSTVVSPTTDGKMCQFPYDLNGWKMHFCLYEINTTDYTCPTKSGKQTCIKGYLLN